MGNLDVHTLISWSLSEITAADSGEKPSPSHGKGLRRVDKRQLCGLSLGSINPTLSLGVKDAQGCSTCAS